MAFRYIEKDKYIIGFCEDILQEVFEELENDSIDDNESDDFSYDD